MRKRVTILVGVLIFIVGASSVVAFGDIFPSPDPGVETVPSKGPGEDYKSNPADPEVVVAPSSDLTLAQAMTLFNPTNDPNVRVCQRASDGSMVIEQSEPMDPSLATGSSVENGKPC